MISIFFFFKNRASCEIMSTKVVELERPQTIWRLREACWISKAKCARTHAGCCAPTPTCTDARISDHTNTHKYVIFIAFPLQQWFRERAPILRYTYIACLVLLYFILAI
jgi:hypothetical protein